ncbi:hypothetical protein KR009_008657 [Drosophila setifemur]|nr:hypothetical protein KR009_008657 [Drosophila setifemur]
MGVLQCVQRSLLLSPGHKMATAINISRMYHDKDKMEARRRRLAVERQWATQCYKALRRSENRCNQPRLKLDIPECLDDPCGIQPLPMDLDHYTPSDKEERIYQRTWCDCYPLPIPRPSTEKKYPNRPRRTPTRPAMKTDVECREVDLFAKSERPKPEKLIELPCGGDPVPWACCKITAPGCPTGRRPPSCDVGRIPSCCKKRRCKYPSFSECIQVGLLDPIPPCECIKKANLCDVFAYWRRKTRQS